MTLFHGFSPNNYSISQLAARCQRSGQSRRTLTMKAPTKQKGKQPTHPTTKKREVGTSKDGPPTAKRNQSTPQQQRAITKDPERIPPPASYRALKEMDKDFGKLAQYVLDGGQLGYERTKAFKSNFGVTIPTLKAIVRNVCFPSSVKPKHILMGLCWMKLYCTEHVLGRMSGYSDRKTVRRYIWIVVEALCNHMPKVVSE